MANMKIRVITPIYNECELLPGFLRHYEKIADSILILDNGSTDGSIEIAKAHPLVELRTFTTDAYDQQAVMDVLYQSQRESREDYDWSLFPDCDEILTMRDGGDLRAHLENVGPDYDVVRATGYTLVKHADEDPFDGRKEWLGQRKFGIPERLYSKPIMLRSSAPVLLTAGNHELNVDPESSVARRKLQDDGAVVLIHFELIDFCLWYYRKTRRAISDANKRRGWTPRFCRETPAYHQMWNEALAKSRVLDKEVPALRGLK